MNLSRLFDSIDACLKLRPLRLCRGGSGFNLFLLFFVLKSVVGYDMNDVNHCDEEDSEIFSSLPEPPSYTAASVNHVIQTIQH